LEPILASAVGPANREAIEAMLVLELSDFVPRKLEKNEASYDVAESQFQAALLQEGKRAA
jgi:hypothetical protein